MARRFVNFFQKFDLNSNINSIEIYKPGLIPYPITDTINSEVNGLLIAFKVRCFFPNSRQTVRVNGTDLFYSNRLLAVDLSNSLGSITVIEFNPFASVSSYTEDLLSKITNINSFAFSQNTSINLRLQDIGDGLLSGEETLEVYGNCSEEWNVNGGI